MTKARLEYRSIPGYKGGELALTICPPGTWNDNSQYLIFVGGCSVGKASNEAEAEAILNSQLVRELQFRITNAQALVRHYVQELETFQRFGLRQRVPHPDADVEHPLEEHMDTVVGILGPFVERGMRAQAAVAQLGAGPKAKKNKKAKAKTPAKE